MLIIPSKKLLAIGYLLFVVGIFARDSIIFPHNFHIEDVEMECSTCHEGVDKSTALSDGFLPAMDGVCSECHEIDDDENCGMCHTEPDDADTYPESSFATMRDFNHSNHLAQISDCSDCHANILEDDGEAEKKHWAQSDCRSCHATVTPQSHDFLWKSEHGLALAESECLVCHTESGCESCHTLQQFEPKTHEVDFILSHGMDARNGMFECSTCHESNHDCQICHNQQMIMPLDHSQLDWVGLNFDNGGWHAYEAMDNPDLCAVCHEPEHDSTCQKCHGGAE
ncbi:MAG: hypothetical protein ISS00_00675 [Candidatus Marinimicrobia bacterium]|nr:hypothetical protein [Candidatus Neomarinimicrobiota bacterium]